MRTVTNVFLLNLAISDLMLGVLCMPFTLTGALLRNFIFGEVMCKMLPFLQGKDGRITQFDPAGPVKDLVGNKKKNRGRLEGKCNVIDISHGVVIRHAL
nr:unnamed protein product [Callosobruchus analis]